MELLAIHKLPWNEEAFREDVEGLGRSLELQYREAWEDAWLFVIRPAAGFDLGQVGLKTEPDQPASEYQAPWLETELADGRVAFYLHGFSDSATLYYGDTEVETPDSSPAPLDLLEDAPYSSPD